MNKAAAARQNDDETPERSSRSRTSSEPHEQRPRRRARRAGVVLIVDDSFDAREMYATYLRHAGFTTYTAPDGRAAVDIAVQMKPDVIIMDLSMPGVDGITATQRIRRHLRTRHIPVVLLTGYPQKAIERGALEAGVNVFLTKPCLPEDIELHVRRLLEAKR
jgi:two-component system, cell cycle response regulator DivK